MKSIILLNMPKINRSLSKPFLLRVFFYKVGGEGLKDAFLVNVNEDTERIAQAAYKTSETHERHVKDLELIPSCI